MQGWRRGRATIHQVGGAGGRDRPSARWATAPRGRGHPGPHPIGVGPGEGRDGQPVGDAPSRSAHRLGGPLPTGSLQHDCPAGIDHQEAVVIGERRALVAARAPLAVLLEQLDHHRHGCPRPWRPAPGRAGAGPSPTGPCRHAGPLGEDGLVADHDAVLVGADLRAPHPPRPGEEHGMGVRHLGHVDPGAPAPGRRRDGRPAGPTPAAGPRWGRGRCSWRTSPRHR